MATTRYVILLFIIICMSFVSYAQDNPSEAYITGKLRGRYWKGDRHALKDWGVVFHRADSIEWRREKVGFAFYMNKTFDEGGRWMCGNSRKKYNGTWDVSKDTLLLDVANKDLIMKFKVVEISSLRLSLKYIKD